MEAFDKAILYFFNHDLANPIFDIFFVTVAESRIFLITMLLAIAIIAWRGSAKVRIGIVLAVICVALLDPLTHYILKPMFGRSRPCHVLDDIRMLVGCGGKFGFPSNHAVNIFAAMTVLSLFIRKYAGLFYTIALLIGISRIYLGRHYPADVLAGALVGSLFSALIIYLLSILILKLKHIKFFGMLNKHFQGVFIWK